MTEDEIAAMKAKNELLELLRSAKGLGVPVTPENLAAAAELARFEQALPFLDGFGYLRVRSA